MSSDPRDDLREIDEMLADLQSRRLIQNEERRKWIGSVVEMAYVTLWGLSWLLLLSAQWCQLAYSGDEYSDLHKCWSRIMGYAIVIACGMTLAPMLYAAGGGSATHGD